MVVALSSSFVLGPRPGVYLQVGLDLALPLVHWPVAWYCEVLTVNRRQWLRLQMPLVHLTASPLVSKASQLHPNHDHLPLQESVCQASSISGLHLKTSQRGDKKTQVQENSLSLLLGTLVGHMAPLPATALQ